MTARRAAVAAFDRAGLPEGPRIAHALGERDVHVWIASVEGSSLAADEAILGDEERARASRFRWEADRRRYVAARGLLRRLLAGYLEEPPGALCFRAGAQGKPELDRKRGEESVSFNLSHARDWVAVAAAKSMPVGVDVEEIEATVDVAALAAIALSDAERRALEEVAPAERCRCFYAAWTCKEAVLKAEGTGLGSGLATVEVPFAAVAAIASRESGPVDFVTGARSQWRVRAWMLADSVACAVAAPNVDWAVSCFAIAAPASWGDTCCA